ncbi:hypothetical protein K469DRAFT_733156 [Zopfia rhizophila CBS 207.26]|uniref:Uncharacterized protein n=1 Tax=Zopfia rhizophila CBS 207.26 TaxID=1314779 RepID=A0A6A6DBX4_9PEZI|nr:hypothetical protein K469DRAFT_733156 [Zopfia rhizophila CBS 207.26]
MAFGSDISSLSKTQKRELVNLLWPKSHLRQHQHQLGSETVDATIAHVQFLRSHLSQPLSRIIADVSKGFLNIDKDSIQQLLELSVRIWLTINVNSPSIVIGPTMAHEMPLRWPQSISLASLIGNQFTKDNAGMRSTKRTRLDRSFTASYLVNVCGMTLRWTDTLTDHLRSNASKETLIVYKHKICLVNHLEAATECPIPKDVLEEALDSLNLLFPFGDASTKKLLAGEGLHEFYRLGNCGRERQLDVSRYEYWGNELDDLVELFRSPPRTWKQLATDRRNKLEWAAFWITVMVAVLTLVSIPCNIIQATYSVKAYHATLAQDNNCPSSA